MAINEIQRKRRQFRNDIETLIYHHLKGNSTGCTKEQIFGRFGFGRVHVSYIINESDCMVEGIEYEREEKILDETLGELNIEVIC